MAIKNINGNRNLEPLYTLAIVAATLRVKYILVSLNILWYRYGS